MKSFATHLEAYLELRHKLGFKLLQTEGLLRHFVRFAREQKASVLTTKLALEWATQPCDCHPSYWASRLGMVRCFAKYVGAFDPRTEVPPQHLLPHRYRRKPPYLYTDQEVCDLIDALRQLPAPDDLRAITHATLFGLLVVTGMRVGEAIGLDRQDVDLGQGLLTVRQTKFNKTRLVPIHPTTRKKLREYERRRNLCCDHAESPGFFLSERGTRLTAITVRHWFLVASRQIGLHVPADQRRPRIHDLRHRFAFKTIFNWYRRGVDVDAHLPELTAYLGHGHVVDTYWYISATPELLKLATQRLEREHGRRFA